jgi:hypothetical protein
MEFATAPGFHFEGTNLSGKVAILFVKSVQIRNTQAIARILAPLAVVADHQVERHVVSNDAGPGIACPGNRKSHLFGIELKRLR